MAPTHRLALLGLTALALAAPARAGVIVNGSFETGAFPPWQTVGNTSVVGAQGNIPVPDGNFQARLATESSGTFAAGLETFLGLPAGRLAALSGSPLGVFNGSAIRQTVTADAGDTLTFVWDFVTNETAGSLFNDFSFVSIVGGSLNESAVLGSVNNSTLTPTTAPGFVRQGGYQPFSFTFAEAGTYTVGVGVVNVGESSDFFGSGLLVDNFALTGGGPVDPIPEPAAVTLLGLGVVGLGAYGWRRKRAA